MLIWVSRQASLHSSFQYRVGTALGCREVASGKCVCRASEPASDLPSCECNKTLPWRRASESASDVPSCERSAARQTDMIMWSRRGHQCSCTIFIWKILNLFNETRKSKIIIVIPILGLVQHSNRRHLEKTFVACPRMKQKCMNGNPVPE